MQTILIIYPHWHPANLAGVQRPRLIGNYLKDFGWKPRVLTVKKEYFEEDADTDFTKTFSKDFEGTRVSAFKITKPRIIGDIGLRAFFQLYKEAKNIIKTEKIDFIWLPIPSFYNALLGRFLYEKTKIPYGIDYIDPWVRDISNQKNKRAIISQWVARILEPIAIKKVSVISGVSTPYYSPVIERNFPTIAKQLLNKDSSNLSTSKPTDQTTYQSNNLIYNPHTHKPITQVGMPYGFDPNDHKVKVENLAYPWKKNSHKNIWLYAGAFLPNSHVLMDAFFKALAELRQEKKWNEDIELWFIGTGSYPAKRITAYAKDYDLSDIVFEDRERYPFLHVLNYLSVVDTVMIIGSTEAHYTASKTYQSLLSERPVISIFHHESSAVKVMVDCKADQYTVRYKPEMQQADIVHAFKKVILTRLNSKEWQPDLSALDKYSSKESARKLVDAIERVL